MIIIIYLSMLYIEDAKMCRWFPSILIPQVRYLSQISEVVVAPARPRGWGWAAQCSVSWDKYEFRHWLTGPNQRRCTEHHRKPRPPWLAGRQVLSISVPASEARAGGCQRLLAGRVPGLLRITSPGTEQDIQIYTSSPAQEAQHPAPASLSSVNHF